MKEEGNNRWFTEMRRKASLLVDQHEERHRGGKVKTVLQNSIKSTSRRIEGLLLGERKREKRCNILARGMSETRPCTKRKVNAFPPNGNQNKVSGSYCQDLSRLKGSKDFIP